MCSAAATSNRAAGHSALNESGCCASFFGACRPLSGSSVLSARNTAYKQIVRAGRPGIPHGYRRFSNIAREFRPGRNCGFEIREEVCDLSGWRGWQDLRSQVKVPEWAVSRSRSVRRLVRPTSGGFRLSIESERSRCPFYCQTNLQASRPVDQEAVRRSSLTRSLMDY